MPLHRDLKRGVAFRAADTIINTTHWGTSPLAQWTQFFTEPGRVPTLSAAAIPGLLFTVHALLSIRMACPVRVTPCTGGAEALFVPHCLKVI
jgi:hypothetical protein